MTTEEILELVRAGYSKDDISGMTENAPSEPSVQATTIEETTQEQTDTVTVSQTEETTDKGSIDLLTQKIAELEKQLQKQNISKPIETVQNKSEELSHSQNGLDAILESLIN